MLVVGVAIVAHGRLLAARRTRPDSLAGRWELPGGKVEVGESPEEAVVREVAEELGCVIRVIRALPGRQPVRPGLDLVVVIAELDLDSGGEPEPREHDVLRWVGAAELDGLDWLEPDLPFLPELRHALRV